MGEVSRFIDLGLEHDKGRLILYGHWDPRELYTVALQVHKRWGSDGVKAFLHHHLMDYACSLLTKLVYGAIVKRMVKDVKRMGFAEVYEDVDTGKLYTSPYASRTLRVIQLRGGDEVSEFIAKRVMGFIRQVLDLMVRDFSGEDDQLSGYISALAGDERFRDCIEEGLKILVSKHVESLLKGREDDSPCRPERKR